MPKRVISILAVAVVVAVGLAVGYVANVFPGEITPMSEIDRASFSDEQIELGENLAMLGDCATCHTPPGQRAMSGNVSLPTPFGIIYSTNITPAPETGIGSWSYAAFERAMRDGIDREGRHLYPAFPYDHFVGITDDDLGALYQFLMVQEPVEAEQMPNELSFPFSFRPLLAGWKLLFHRQGAFAPNPDFTDEENRGAYLAETLGHCSACHSPRNVFGAVNRSAHFAGGEAEGWLIPPLAGESITPLGWDVDDYADYLFDGWSRYHGVAGGPMTPIVDNLYPADEDDVFAIAAWLARITPEFDEDEREARLAEIEARDLPEGFDTSLGGADVSDAVLRGAEVFEQRCIKCHVERLSNTQPASLGLTYAVNAPEPTNLFNAVLQGIQPSFGSPSRKMEAVVLDEDDLAALAAFVRWQFTDEPAWDDLSAQAAAAVSASR